ncbi:MAG: S41 family peptidase [Bdellovibrionota bacterium]
MKLFHSALKPLGLMIAALTVMTACDPVPRRELTAEEKQADMMWLYSKFGANYAPLEYKEKLWNLDYETLKKTYLQAAAETADNDAFYALVQQFVAEFKDAHTSVSFTASGRPGREKVSYLGFTGRREGDNFVVTELFPTITAETTSYPITVGTIITKYNGVPLKQYIKETFSKSRDVGQDDANVTYLMGRLFTRLDIQTPIAKELDVVLTVKQDDGEVDVTVPWVEKDLYSFQKDIAAANAAKKAAGEQGKPASSETMIATTGNTQIPFSFMTFNGSAFNLNLFDVKQKVMSFKDRISSSKIDYDIAGWTTQLSKLNFSSNQDKLTKLRVVPDGAIMIEDSVSYPAYVFPTEVAGKTIMMGYIMVDTFSPDTDVVPELKITLEKMQKIGVQDLVIDTINNGGGSLTLLMQMAQLLSNKPVIQPGLQIGLNEGWIDSIEDATNQASSDGEKVLYQRLFKDMMNYKAQGLRITPKESAYSLNVLVPFGIKPHKELKKDFNVVLLVNEMCASACDIFAGLMQDNKMATLVGSRTMGAGGNVVNYIQSPNTNMDIRQTESLIVRTNGEYIENVGVTPDVQMVVSESASLNYEPLRAKAVEILSAKYLSAPAATAPVSAR